VGNELQIPLVGFGPPGFDCFSKGFGAVDEVTKGRYETHQNRRHPGFSQNGVANPT
jgi:hypothetical protein